MEPALDALRLNPPREHRDYLLDMLAAAGARDERILPLLLDDLARPPEEHTGIAAMNLEAWGRRELVQFFYRKSRSSSAE